MGWFSLKRSCAACRSRSRLPEATPAKWKTRCASMRTRSLPREKPPRRGQARPNLNSTPRWKLFRSKIDQDIDDVILGIRAQPVSHLRIMHRQISEDGDRRLFEFCESGVEEGLVEDLPGREPPRIAQSALAIDGEASDHQFAHAILRPF